HPGAALAGDRSRVPQRRSGGRVDGGGGETGGGGANGCRCSARGYPVDRELRGLRSRAADSVVPAASGATLRRPWGGPRPGQCPRLRPDSANGRDDWGPVGPRPAGRGGRRRGSRAANPLAGGGMTGAQPAAEFEAEPVRDAAAAAVLRARVWLSRTVEPGSAVVYSYVGRVGPVEAARPIRAGTAPAEVAVLAAARRDQDLVDADLATAARYGIRILIPEDDEWPAFPLLRMETATARGVSDLAPPLMLWVRGRARLDD